MKNHIIGFRALSLKQNCRMKLQQLPVIIELWIIENLEMSHYLF